MKKLIPLFIIILLSIHFSPFVNAQGSPMKLVPPTAPQNSFFGQTHKYSVLFRRSGSAVVTAQFVITNTTDSPIESLTYATHGNLEHIRALQLLQKPICLRYEPYPADLKLMPNRPYPAPCAEFGEPQYDYYWQSPSSYKAITPTISGPSITLTLPTPIEAKKTGSILISYTDTSLTKNKLLGAKAFTFTTLTSEDTIQSVNVGISTDDELYLKDAHGTVNEQTKAVSGLAMATDSMAAPEMARISQYLPTLGYGQINKSAQQLAPHETLTVKGVYANRAWKLYAKEGLMGLVGVSVILIFLLLLAKWAMKLMQQQAKSGNKTDTTLVLSALTGFGGALVISASVIALVVVQPLVQQYVSYQISGIVTILLLLVSIGVWSCALFLPALVMGMKRGTYWGIATFAATIAWLVVDAIGVLIIVLVFFRNYSSPVPYLMDSVRNSVTGGASSGSTTPVKGVPAPGFEDVPEMQVAPQAEPSVDTTELPAY